MKDQSVSKKITEKIYQKVRSDLEPPLLTVTLKSIFSVGVGGLLSLLFCGQFGMGLSSVATAFNLWIMQTMGAVGCSIACGLLFSVFPVCLLRTICSAVQFRVIVRKKWQAIVASQAVFGGILIQSHSMFNPIAEVLVWVSAAMISFEMLSWLLDRILNEIARLRFRFISS